MCGQAAIISQAYTGMFTGFTHSSETEAERMIDAYIAKHGIKKLVKDDEKIKDTARLAMIVVRQFSKMLDKL